MRCAATARSRRPADRRQTAHSTHDHVGNATPNYRQKRQSSCALLSCQVNSFWELFDARFLLRLVCGMVTAIRFGGLSSFGERGWKCTISQSTRKSIRRRRPRLGRWFSRNPKGRSESGGDGDLLHFALEERRVSMNHNLETRQCAPRVGCIEGTYARRRPSRSPGRQPPWPLSDS